MKPRLLANENFPIPSVTVLRAAGFDVLAMAEHRPGLGDAEVLALAVSEGRWVLTFDRDYGELVYSKGLPPPPCVIYLRLASYRSEDPGRMLVDLLQRDLALSGYFVVVEADSLRKQPLLSLV